LLEFQGQGEHFIETSALEVTARSVGTETTDAIAGQQIGPFIVEREIGRGGMGAVYLAQQNDNHYQRQVAIKVIKRGMDSDEIVRRFRNERQILANLTHPNIAGLYTGGTTEAGLPFFVMEYVEGQPINEYCEERNLSIEDRLKLFRIVCSALSQAHQNLVIHRDLKPSNILVTAAGVPKLLDFGIAKLLKPAEEVAVTATMMRVMTPEYASPEQARGERMTTASDVYSLGVVLYELLTGRRPHRFKSRLPHEIAQIISEQVPERPSTAVRTDQAADQQIKSESTSTTQAGGATAFGDRAKLRRRLRGDIDNIVLMAMHKDPARRYQSMDQLSEDIRRHLEGLPVRAHQDSLGYRASKFVRRNRISVAVAAMLLLVLFAGILATAWEARRAERRFNDVRVLANSFLFEFDDAIKDLQGSTPARELIIRRALQYLDSLSREAGNDPGLQLELATAYDHIGQIQGNTYYTNLGDTEGALRSYRNALGLLEALAAKEPGKRDVQRELAASYEGLGDVLYAKDELPEGLKDYEKALVIRRQLVAQEPANIPLRRELAGLYSHMGDIKGLPGSSNLGDMPGALAAHRESLRLREELAASDPNNHEDQFGLAGAVSSVGFVSNAAGDTNGAIELLRRSIALLEGLGVAEPANVRYRMELETEYMRFANIVFDDGQYEIAADLARRTIKSLELRIAKETENSLSRYNLALSYNFLGRSLTRLSDTAGALAAHAQALKINEDLAQADPTSAEMQRGLWLSHQRTAEAYFAGRDFLSAAKYYRRAVALEEALLAVAPDNAQARDEHSIGLAGLGLSLNELGNAAGAQANLLRAQTEADALATQSPANSRLQMRLALRLLEYGRISAGFMRQSPSGERAQRVRSSRDLLTRSLDIWRSLRDQGKLSRVDAGKPDEVAREIARCDEVLRKEKGSRAL
jgi:serine/threonine protein kinase/tetratricopeptide (TPR) repeat protein